MKKIFIVFFVFIAAASFATVSRAATLIESKDKEGGIQKMWIQGSKMRMDFSHEKGYSLFDAKARKMYVVNPNEKTIMDVSWTLEETKTSGKSKYKIKFTKKGSGPSIAGYATNHFEFFVNDNKCKDEFLSLKALNDIEAHEIFDAMPKQGPMDLEGMPPGMISPCDAVAASLGEQYKKYGFPLRIIDKTGTVDSEVTRISKNSPPPRGGFDPPSGYTVRKMGDMNKMMREMPQKGDSMPEMPKDFDPEKMQKMMQEMMKQRGQQ